MHGARYANSTIGRTLRRWQGTNTTRTLGGTKMKPGTKAQLQEASLPVSDGGCLESVDGTTLKRSSGDPCLRSKNLIVNDETCPYHIEGVSGGPVLYPEQVTGVPKTRDGRDNVCFMYSIISGTILKSAKNVEGNCGTGGGTGEEEEEEETESIEDNEEEEEEEEAADGTTPAEGDGAGKASGAHRMVAFSMHCLVLVLFSLFVVVQRH
eukprot:Tamp_06531.p2 GENE.Tamp_06531~~Tamp_06531.p2  ORF type:complete len:209 (-),score=32.11 Tamp_06531:350-976(-)